MPPDPCALCPSWGRRHAKRLREVYRSAGWPFQDDIEVELLAAGLLQRVDGPHGAPQVRVTDLGLQAIVQARQGHLAARTAHQRLVDEVSDWLQSTQGRLVWQGLQVRSPLGTPGTPDTRPGDPVACPGPGPLQDQAPVPLPFGWGDGPSPAPAIRWRTCIPDVYSLRHSSVQAYLEPAVHEVKVSRADLLGDLKNPDKRGAYQAIAAQCWYVLGLDGNGRPIAQPSEIPEACGVVQASLGGLVVLRPAWRRPMPELPFTVWMALARCTPARPDEHPARQAPLGPVAGAAA